MWKIPVKMCLRAVATVLLVFLGLPVIVQASQNSQPISFAVYAADPKVAAEIGVILRDGHSSAQIITVASLSAAAQSKANVLVLFVKDDEKAVQSDVEALRNRKVLGLGYGTAQIFEDLGLQISSGNCAHKTFERAQSIIVQKNDTVAEPAPGTVLTAFRLAEAPKDKIDYDFALFVQEKSQMRQLMDVIARWPSDMNYAAVARQGGYVLVGLAPPPETWTPEYRALFRNLAYRLQARKPEPFPVANWRLTKPGTYRLKLARFLSTDALCSDNLYFRFTRPTHFTAHLEQRGSKELLFAFYSEPRPRVLDYHNAKNDGPLDVSADITETDIKSGIQDWYLHLCNFDREHEAECTVTVRY